MVPFKVWSFSKGYQNYVVNFEIIIRIDQLGVKILHNYHSKRNLVRIKKKIMF